jgi:hypothetical protein
MWSADSGDDIYASTAPVINTNYQMAWRYTGPGAYIIDENGTEVLHGSAIGGLDWRTGTHGIGNHVAATERRWGGLIAEMIFYNGIYTTSEVATIESSIQSQGGITTVTPASSLPYRVYNLGKMLLNNGTLILR